MDQAQIDKMEAMEESYWWHQGRRHLVTRFMTGFFGPEDKMEILDVGCGTGRNLNLLERWGTVLGVEPEGPGLEACRKAGRGPDRVMAAPADRLPFPDASFDLVTAFDVLEHLEDDQAGLREFHRVLRPGGHLLLTVPAYRFLWSIHDEALGHRRRYVASEIHSLLNNSGFSTLRRSYAITFALPAIASFRILQGLIPSLYQRGASYVEVPTVANAALVGLIRLESWLLRMIDLPLGTSILALAKKKREG